MAAHALGAQAALGDGGLRGDHAPAHHARSGAPSHVITIDGVEYDANAAMVLVANCGEVIPPYVRLGAGIRPDDGLLDVVVMRANSFGQSVRAVWDLLRDAPTADGQETYVGYARGREIRVETDPVAAGAARRRGRRRDPVHRHGGSRGDQDHGAGLRDGASAADCLIFGGQYRHVTLSGAKGAMLGRSPSLGSG